MKPTSPAALALALLLFPASATAAPPAGASRQEAAGEVIERGRALLEEGRVPEAEAEFERAHKLAPGPATRMWVLRGRIARGRALDVLQEVGSLELDEADKSYLEGMALFAKAKAEIEGGTPNAFTESQLGDAAEFLGRATAVDGARYRDAWLPLAEAAWMSRKLDLAAGAAARAVERRPADAAAHLLRGRVALSRFVAAHPGAGRDAAHGEDPEWKLAAESFAKAAERLAAAGDAAAEADALVQLGNACLWVDAARAVEPFAGAIAADPARVPFGDLAGSMGAPAFAAAVVQGRERFEKRHGAGHASAPLLAWWAGYGLFADGKLADAEQAFRRAVELQPGFTNSWYYIFRASYGQQAFDRAVQALERGFEADPAGFPQAFTGDLEFNVRVLDYLVSWCANAANHGGRVLHERAARLSELAARVAPGEARFWNNMGLFLRDQAEGLYRTRKPAEQERARELWERSLVAYEKALALEPERPGYINDTAVMLHYYLQRDLERAKLMYTDAARLAQEQLQKQDLPADEREWLQTALRDARTNLRKLERRLEEIAEGTAKPREPGDQN